MAQDWMSWIYSSTFLYLKYTKESRKLANLFFFKKNCSGYKTLTLPTLSFCCDTMLNLAKFGTRLESEVASSMSHGIQHSSHLLSGTSVYCSMFCLYFFLPSQTGMEVDMYMGMQWFPHPQQMSLWIIDYTSKFEKTPFSDGQLSRDIDPLL